MAAQRRLSYLRVTCLKLYIDGYGAACAGLVSGHKTTQAADPAESTGDTVAASRC